MPSHDVLIIGAGLAGQRAALAAADAGATVAIMSKAHPVRSHSVAAAGGINPALNPQDPWESHAFDPVKGSDYLGDQDAIEIMAREAPEEILHLEHIGVTFHRNEHGQLGTRAFGGASQARTYYVADITGQAILHVLYEQLMKYSDKVDRYEEWFTTSLIQDDEGACVGCIARDVRTGAMEVFRAKNVILASGGCGQAFKPTTNGLIVTGDGDRKSTRLNSSHANISYAVFCLKKKNSGMGKRVRAATSPSITDSLSQNDAELRASFERRYRFPARPAEPASRIDSCRPVSPRLA